MPPPPSPPGPQVPSKKRPAESEFDDLLPRSGPELAPPGPDRVKQLKTGECQSRFAWVADTWEQVGTRPQPTYRQGWTGWKDYMAKVTERERENEAIRPGPKEKRQALARKLNKGDDLFELKDNTTGRKVVDNLDNPDQATST